MESGPPTIEKPFRASVPEVDMTTAGASESEDAEQSRSPLK
jgi:hypothetical protein